MQKDALESGTQKDTSGPRLSSNPLKRFDTGGYYSSTPKASKYITLLSIEQRYRQACHLTQRMIQGNLP
jgi:hypothetical protein